MKEQEMASVIIQSSAEQSRVKTGKQMFWR